MIAGLALQEKLEAIQVKPVPQTKPQIKKHASTNSQRNQMQTYLTKKYSLIELRKAEAAAASKIQKFWRQKMRKHKGTQTNLEIHSRADLNRRLMLSVC